MATYRARLSTDPTGAWVASAIELPNCWSTGVTRVAALERLRREIRYRIEFCPCSGVDDAFVQVEVEPAEERPARAASNGVGSDVPDSANGALGTPVAPLSGVLGCPPEPPPAAAASSVWPETPATGAVATNRTAGWRRWDD